MGGKITIVCAGLLFCEAQIYDNMISAIAAAALWVGASICYVNEKNHKT